MWKFSGLMVGAVFACLAPKARAEEVVVFAAASLKSALDQVAADFTRATGHKVILSYAGSNQLAKQIQQGAAADLFLSASEPWMDEIAKDGLIVEGKRRDLLGNALVLIGPEGAPEIKLSKEFDLAALIGEGPLAMALVDAVPAGQYGKSALIALGKWEAVASKVAQSDNVRAAAALVERGEAPFGIVYGSDALAGRVSVVARFPEESHPPIRYPVALLTAASDPADVAFYDWLASPEAAARFTAQGFTLVD